VSTIRDVSAALRDRLETVIFGKRSAIDDVLTCLFAGGHLLIEDVPGTAKTLLARSLARLLGGDFARLQCTPDLLPGEVTGTSVYRPDTQAFEFHPGPIFAHVLLADEINRATPRTQSALLEAMAEGQVTVDGTTRPLPAPFFVIATQNPIDQEGTFALPEAQLDRFMMRISIGYPPPEAEEQMLLDDTADPLSRLEPVLSPGGLAKVQSAVRQVTVHPEIRRWIVELATTTRNGDAFHLGCGPRATRALYRAAQARAAIDGRKWVAPDDVRGLVLPVFAHRVLLSPRARIERVTPTQAIETASRLVAVPNPSVIASAAKASPGSRTDSAERTSAAQRTRPAVPPRPLTLDES
jgi:MoxR-like ATPase